MRELRGRMIAVPRIQRRQRPGGLSALGIEIFQYQKGDGEDA